MKNSGITVLDAQSNYTNDNKTAEDITGYSRDELIRMNLIQLIALDDHPVAHQHFSNLSKTRHTSGELRFVKKNGDQRHWRVDA